MHIVLPARPRIMTGFRPSLFDAIPQTVAVSTWGMKKEEAVISEDQSLAMTAYILEAMNLSVQPRSRFAFHLPSESREPWDRQTETEA